jgi:polar amino acid transport system permease protein
MRAIPFLVVLLLIHFGAQKIVRGTPATLTGCAALAIYASAYFAEVMRAAVASVPKGQWEAAAALGLHPALAFYKVILAQMAVVFVPAGQVVAIMLLKESAVLSIITVPELTHSALRIQAETFQTVPTFVFVTLCYWAAITLLSNAALAFEPRFLSAARNAAPRRRFRRAGPSGAAP